MQRELHFLTHLVEDDVWLQYLTLRHNLVEQRHTKHTHECARHTVTRTVGSHYEKMLMAVGVKPVIVAAHDVPRTEKHEVVVVELGEERRIGRHGGLYALCIYDTVGHLLVGLLYDCLLL